MDSTWRKYVFMQIKICLAEGRRTREKVNKRQGDKENKRQGDQETGKQETRRIRDNKNKRQ